MNENAKRLKEIRKEIDAERANLERLRELLADNLDFVSVVEKPFARIDARLEI